MSTPVPIDPPPAYRAHRGVLIAVVVIALGAFSLALAAWLPQVVQWTIVTVQALHETWLGWNWHLL